ncbi:MAG: 5-dehydro-4-deoxy-D-glucuronate isomerase [Fidelibacterota bacterium]|nr:MAG: 5-dehydro-4-deoxy-D-glucuronate isomerase [Candidatus Neomarinimicrobiota bacterium]
MKVRYLADKVRYRKMVAEELRATFLVEDLFEPDQVCLYYTETDRCVVGSAVPGKAPLRLEGGKELASEYFAERREIGVINIGAAGSVAVDGTSHPLDNRECLYIGRGSREIMFHSADPKNHAKFYLMSFPAHTEYPTKKVDRSQTAPVALGSVAGANKRTIYKCIHPAAVMSCQLVMGFTELEEGSVWNTMPPHTHERRTEIYMYFDLGDEILFHFMGQPDETRHLVVREGQAVLSPSWSIHAGVGTGPYTFIWGMGGENQEFDDMDGVDTGGIR